MKNLSQRRQQVRRRARRTRRNSYRSATTRNSASLDSRRSSSSLRCVFASVIVRIHELTIMDFLIDLSKDSADACANNAVPTRRMTCTSPRLITMELSSREYGPWRSDQDSAKQGDSGRMVALAAYEQLASTMSGLRHMRSWSTPVRYPLFLLREVYVRLNVLPITL